MFLLKRSRMLLGDLCLRLSFLVEVQRPAAFQSGQCSSHAAFLVGRAGQLPCCFSSGQCSFSCLFGATGRWRCQVGGRHLPIVSYGQSYKQTYSDTGFSEPTVFAHLNRIVSLHCRQNRRSTFRCSRLYYGEILSPEEPGKSREIPGKSVHPPIS